MLMLEAMLKIETSNTNEFRLCYVTRKDLGKCVNKKPNSNITNSTSDSIALEKADKLSIFINYA